MLETHIEDGRKLVGRLESYPDDISTVPHGQQITTSEITAWFSAAETMIASMFGKRSEPMNKWHGLQAEMSTEASARIQDGTWKESRSAIDRVNKSLGLLTEFQHYANSGLGLSWSAGNRWEKVLTTFCVALSMAFLAVLLWKGLDQAPIPDRQWNILRTIMALAGAGFVVAIPGFITVEIFLKNIVVRAFGAIAVFVIIYFVPAAQ